MFIKERNFNMKLFNEHEEYTKPFFEGGTIIGESFFPVYKKGESGEMVIPMMNRIAKIIEVRRTDRSTVYAEGIDYILRDGKLVLPEGTSIHIMPWEEYCRPEGGDPVFDCCYGGNLLFYNENQFHTMQYEITYEADGSCFDGQYVPTADSRLNCARKKLENNETLKLAFYGDSITYGMNASGLFAGAPPYMPVYPKLIAETLEGRGKKIHYYNPSISGISSWQGIAMVDRTLCKFVPDLTVIAFGMNDGAKQNIESADLINGYISNIRAIIEKVKTVNPKAEFILVSTTLPTPIAPFFNKYQPDLEEPLKELANQTGSAFLNMTKIHRFLLTRKEYHHMTGNNINHPCDFLARFYAQGILALLGQ